MAWPTETAATGRNRVLRCALACCVGCSLWPEVGRPNEPDAPSARREDFSLQGEYSGNLSGANGARRTSGLAIVALGRQEFQAVEYPGGLPGNGWNERERITYAGRRDGEILYLTGPAGRLIVERQRAMALHADGALRGTLKKVHRASPTLGAAPPPGAVVLFDGSATEEFNPGRMTADRLLEAGADTRRKFHDFHLHVEFRTPFMPDARGQARGNSGVYIQGRYEVQILDSFGLEGLDNECGGLYKSRAPRINVCLPPGAWQTYEIRFTAARFDTAGRRCSKARITVRHNGVVIHDHVDIPGKTGAGAVEGPQPGPIRFQYHGDAVHFRNIWICPVGGNLPTFDRHYLAAGGELAWRMGLSRRTGASLRSSPGHQLAVSD
jgi:hypothetical protein